MKAYSSAVELWPSLLWDEWKETATTLHMWMQIVGKTRLALTPQENHWWNVPLIRHAARLVDMVDSLP